jgi:hypothetical protein
MYRLGCNESPCILDVTLESTSIDVATCHPSRCFRRDRDSEIDEECIPIGCYPKDLAHIVRISEEIEEDITRVSRACSDIERYNTYSTIYG